MPIKPRTDLKEEFQNGDIPDQNDFADTIDSALNLTDDGLISYKVDTPVGVLKRFGFGGEEAPVAPIGIKGEEGQDDVMIAFTSHDENQKWNINLNPTGANLEGFSIDDASAGSGESRIFIEKASEGNIGVGNVAPQAKLHVTGANDGANVSIMVENLESGPDGGWLMSAIDDNVAVERMKAFALHEKKGTDLDERITVLGTLGPSSNPIKNVGINEVLPYATLHVTKPASDPTEPVNLAENTGILCLGEISNDNLAMDSRQIQARHGEFVASGPTLSFTASVLSLQPYGGGLTINSESFNSSDHVAVSADGKLAIGGSSTEKVTVNGAVVFGDTTTPVPPDGSVRWSPVKNDLQVWKDATWKSLTTHTNTDGLWTDAGGGTIYYKPAAARAQVGIGTEAPTSMLHVKEDNVEAGGNVTATAILNTASTMNSEPNIMRAGMAISCTGVWSPNPAALNVGLYVVNATGQTEGASNIAALLNGNTVIGNVTGNSLLGTNARNVLAIQNGDAPTSHAGITETAGVQIYSANVTALSGVDMSVFHVMTGDGAIIRLFRQPSLTPANTSTPDTGDGPTNVLIENMRERINQLETIIKALGIVTP